MSKFTGRVCVVTGAGGGIGRALALGLAKRGARLAISDLKEPGVAETAKLAEEHHAEVHYTTLDVSDADAYVAYAREVVEHFGVVNQVYNNAGVWLTKSILESDFEDFEKVLSVDLWGVVHGTKLFLPHLIDSGEGHVINISSINGILAQANTSHYCAAKFAVRGFTESLRLELQASNHPVHALSVHPGGINTGIASSALHDAHKEGEELSAKDLKMEKLYNEVILRMKPDDAADAILKAVEKNSTRVLVGYDAKALDLAVRAAPALTLTIVGKVLERLWR